MSRWLRRVDNEEGQLFPMVLGLLVIAALVSVVFVTYVVARQRLAGHRYQVLAARYLAEAGVERAIWTLQHISTQRPLLRGSSEAFRAGALRGRFTIESVDDEAGGLVAMVTTGEVQGLRRGVRATVKFSPLMLRYALFGERLLRFEGAASRTYVVPAPTSAACAMEARLGSNREIWFVNPGVALNEFTGAVLRLRDGDQPDHALLGNGSASIGSIGQVVIPDGAGLSFGSVHQPIAHPDELRSLDVRMGTATVAGAERQALPAIDGASLRVLAERNTANAELNETVGRLNRWPALRLKRHSMYSRQEFALLVSYLAGASGHAFHGPVYVRGPVVVSERTRLRFLDGFLAAEGSVTVQIGGTLEVRHSSRSRLFPGLVTIGETAPLVVQQDATLIVDGLVYAQRIFDAGEGAVIDIVGALIAADPLLSFRNHSATVVIRYDPVVLGTIGVRPTAGAGAVARIVAWTEVR